MKIKSVLLDLDGTLLDSLTTVYHAVFTAIRELNLPPLTRKQIKDNIHNSVEGAFLQTYPEHGDKLEAFRRSFTAHYLSNFKKTTRIIPGSIETLRSLHRRGVKIGIVTSRTKSFAGRMLEYFKIPYDVLLSRDDTVNGRPDPEPLERAMNYLHSRPSETIYVGDTPHDIEQGKRAHVTTIGVSSGLYTRQELAAQHPDFLIDSVSELTETVGLSG
jgi:pyrophosphatase PpaX